MALTIQLLGPPQIVVDETPATVRGRKAWAVLALLVLRTQRVSRQRLAELLFADADDPLGALRWSLAQLRRALGPGATVGGDPVSLVLPAGSRVDVDAALAATPAGQPVELLGVPGPLLEGLFFDGCPAFETWLAGERRRVAVAVHAVLREDALAALAGGRPQRALDVATQLVAEQPLDEAHQTLLVEALAATGDQRAARQQARRCTLLFEAELGGPPSPQVRAAAERRRSPTAPLGRAAIVAQLDAGHAAIGAGAVEAGLDCLRRAAAAAAQHREPDLHLEALVALGGALIHTVRGHDEEAAAVLHEALAVGADLPPSVTLAHAHRKLATIDVMVGRRDRAEAWFAAADSLGFDDVDERASIAGWRAFNFTDMGRYADARVQYARSLELARSCGSRRQVSWSEAGLGRLHLLRGDLDSAAAAFDASLTLARVELWTAFVSYPETLCAEVHRRQDRIDDALPLLEHAYALGRQIGDPCWSGVSARTIGMCLAAHGDHVEARRMLLEAEAHVVEVADTNRWIQAFVIDGHCRLLLELDDRHGAEVVADRLLALASAAAMPEVVARAQLHRARLGVDGALDAARLSADGLDNPELRSELERMTMTVG